jgi:hypothetical protein
MWTNMNIEKRLKRTSGVVYYYGYVKDETGQQYLNLDISKYKNENLVTLGILRSPEFTPPPPYNDRTNDPAFFQSCSVSTCGPYPTNPVCSVSMQQSGGWCTNMYYHMVLLLTILPFKYRIQTLSVFFQSCSVRVLQTDRFLPVYSPIL